MEHVIKQETSAGGVIYRRAGDSYEFLLGKHSGYHKWVLPKGMVEEGETLLQTAEREVFEEVGVKVKIVSSEPVKVIAYDYLADLDEVVNKNPHTEETVRRVVKYQEEGGGTVKVYKTVSYYLMEFVSDTGVHGWEMEDRQWVSYQDGMKILAFESEQTALRAAGKILRLSEIA
jgi:8-oxo-dGTP pyrophosphatase MutT (NUDIX family)